MFLISTHPLSIISSQYRLPGVLWSPCILSGDLLCLLPAPLVALGSNLALSDSVTDWVTAVWLGRQQCKKHKVSGNVTRGGAPYVSTNIPTSSSVCALCQVVCRERSLFQANALHGNGVLQIGVALNTLTSEGESSCLFWGTGSSPCPRPCSGTCLITCLNTCLGTWLRAQARAQTRAQANG